MIEATTLLADCIGSETASLGFQRVQPAPPTSTLLWIAAWKRKTWNTNRGIALLALPDEARHAGEYALDVRAQAGKFIGYIPFLYELGLQLVLSGPGILKKGEGLERYVTKINNSTVLLQSLHLVDLQTRESISVRTWGQVVTGKMIDAVEKGIARFRETGALPPSKP